MKTQDINTRIPITETIFHQVIIVREVSATNYTQQKKKFYREFGEIMDDTQTDPYLDFLLRPVSKS